MSERIKMEDYIDGRIEEFSKIIEDDPNLKLVSGQIAYILKYLGKHIEESKDESEKISIKRKSLMNIYTIIMLNGIAKGVGGKMDFEETEKYMRITDVIRLDELILRDINLN